MAKTYNTPEEYTDAILSGDRLALSRAITLIESTREDHQRTARDIVNKCAVHTGNGLRIGITGPPGAGKSTFIDSIGAHLTAMGKQVAVLAVDPTSQRSKGSILGDKTRMTRLASHPASFIRPSPNSGAYGGLTSYTREALILCEAAGYDVIFVETVGVGQSETEVHSMVDFLLLLIITGAGDEIQGIKRGIMEMADLIVVNKADGQNAKEADLLRRSLKQLFHIMPEPRSGWTRQVLTASSIQDEGIENIWETIKQFEEGARASGEISSTRKAQSISWMNQHIERRLIADFKRHKEIQTALDEFYTQVENGTQSPMDAADTLLQRYFSMRKLP